MKTKLFLLFLSFSVTLFAQQVERTTIQGRIIANDSDVENVTVFNASSNKGTITSNNGEFKIEVALNDILNISALQFEQLKVTVNADVIKTKQLTVFLVERVNKLNEVVLLPYGLSGNVAVDVESIETFNPDLDAIYFGVNDVGSFEFSDDYKSEVKNFAINERSQDYDLNIGAILGVVAKSIFKNGKSQKKSDDINDLNAVNKSLTDVYAHAVLSRMLDLQNEEVDKFIDFVEQDNMDRSLLKEGNEVELLEHLVKQREEFIKSSGEKN